MTTKATSQEASREEAAFLAEGLKPLGAQGSAGLRGGGGKEPSPSSPLPAALPPSTVTLGLSLAGKTLPAPCSREPGALAASLLSRAVGAHPNRPCPLRHP